MYGRFRLNPTSRLPSSQVSAVDASGTLYSSGASSSSESLRSMGAASIISISSESQVADTSMHTATFSRAGSTMSGVLGSSGSSTSSSPSDGPRTASGVRLPVPLSLEEIGEIQLWSRTVTKPMITARELRDILYDTDSCIRFLVEQRILYGFDLTTMTSPLLTCEGGELLRFTYNVGRGFVWRCHRYNCVCNKSSLSPLVDSFFAVRKSPLELQFEILHFWLNSCSRKSIRSLTSANLRTIKGIIDDFHQVMQHDFIINSPQPDLDELEEDDNAVDIDALPAEVRHTFNNPNKIGGYNRRGEKIVVEIDESKFDKRKYHNGHRVEGVWVIGGVERTPERRVFMVTVPNRNRETTERIIRRYVNRGTVIHTDYWLSYLCIPQMGRNFEHRRVNHSVNYRAPDGTHTNTIEGTWYAIKIRCFPRQRTKKNMPWILLEFMWRRKYHGDLFGGLLKTLRDVEFDRRTRESAFITEVVEEEESYDSTDEDTEEEADSFNMDVFNNQEDITSNTTQEPFVFIRRSQRLANRRNV